MLLLDASKLETQNFSLMQVNRRLNATVALLVARPFEMQATLRSASPHVRLIHSKRFGHTHFYTGKIHQGGLLMNCLFVPTLP